MTRKKGGGRESGGRAVIGTPPPAQATAAADPAALETNHPFYGPIIAELNERIRELEASR